MKQIFQTPQVNDLAWVIASPSLMAPALPGAEVVSSQWCTRQFQQHYSWLTALDANPSPLIHFLAQHPFNLLGKYFEQLLIFWLQQSPFLELLIHNTQIIENRQTLGELDVVFLDLSSQKYFHWEITVKFYLGTIPATGEWQSWIGPNANDTLDKKLNKALHQQLPLAHASSAKALLASKGIQEVTSKLFCKGYFFYPKGGVLPPNFASSDHLRGHWTTVSAFAQTNDELWQVLPKTNWLGGKGVASTRNNIIDQVNNKCRPLMLKNQENNERWIIVPDQWPYA